MDYFWTKHAKEKLRFYNLSEARIHRVIRHPFRVEEGVAENTIAVMQPSSVKANRKLHGANGKKTWSQEIWCMFVKAQNANRKAQSEKGNLKIENCKLKIISAWRYPGVSPKRNPIPREIIDELKGQL